MEISWMCVVGIVSLLFCVSISSVSALVGNSPCRSYAFDETKFVTRYESIAGSPPLLRYLAEKDEIIHAVVSGHYNATSMEQCYGDQVSRFALTF